MIVDSYGHPVERFDPARHTGWLDPDGRHVPRPGFDDFQGAPTRKVDLFGRPIMQYDPAIHVKDMAELRLDRLRMDQYMSGQRDDGVEPPEE